MGHENRMELLAMCKAYLATDWTESPSVKRIMAEHKDLVYVQSPQNIKLKELVEKFTVVNRQRNDSIFHAACSMYGEEATEEMAPEFCKRRRARLVRQEAEAEESKKALQVNGANRLTYAQVASGSAQVLLPVHTEALKSRQETTEEFKIVNHLTYAQVVSVSQR